MPEGKIMLICSTPYKVGNYLKFFVWDSSESQYRVKVSIAINPPEPGWLAGHVNPTGLVLLEPHRRIMRELGVKNPASARQYDCPGQQWQEFRNQLESLFPGILL